MSNIINQAASFAKAMAVQVMAGCPTASKDQQKERHDICGQCPFLVKDGYKCGVCSCRLALKIPLATSYCPKKYWGAITTTEENKSE